MKKLLLLPCLLIAFTSVAQTILTIQTTGEKCATVSTNDRNHAFKDQGFGASRGVGGEHILRSFLLFDLSSIPQGSRVNWAKLSLYVRGIEGTCTPLLRRVTSPWDPKTVTWNTQPSTTKHSTIRLAKTTNGLFAYKNIDVWKLVQAMVDSPATSFGFGLKLDTERSNLFSSISFNSPGIGGQPDRFPKLVIEYSPPSLQSALTSMAVDLTGASTQMTIYPNPCNGIFNCNIKSTTTDKMTFRVIDMIGRTVYSQPVNTSSLQMRVNLPVNSAGTYFVILQDNTGATIVSQELQVD